MILAAKRAWPSRPLRVGIINIMPKAETYEPYLLRPLDRAVFPVEPVWIRLRTHRYASSDAEHIARRYVEYEQATRDAPLDGLVLTGAPVEELAFHDVHYWDELSEILRAARGEVPNTLGLCWGALALAGLLGLQRRLLEEKLFGIFENTNLQSDHPIMGGADDVFQCAHSRHAGNDDIELERARDGGHLRLLAYGVETGYTIFESADRRFLMHLGHPEYEPVRLTQEWVRDSALGRSDVRAPRHFDPNRPVHVWRSHCNDFFAQWLRFIASAATQERAARGPAIDALEGRMLP
jgi:homoserine O-succinyltransferase